MNFPIISSILVAILNFFGIFQPGIRDVPGEQCLRPCVKGGAPLRCHYKFVVESYYVLSLACFKCPYNITDCYRKDCVPTVGTLRTIMTVNRMIPGPGIQVCQGDTIVVNVSNRAEPQTTSMHWHGIFQIGTPYMDGVPMVTQCPIQPFDWFLYTFTVPSSGTYFWHAHVAAQKADGLFGSLIVREQGDERKYNYDYDLPEHVVVVNDWYNASVIDMVAKSLFYNEKLLQPFTILVNGKGRYTTYTMDGKTYKTPLAVFTVQRGKRYRFRLIGSNVQCGIQVSIASHLLEIIATDGSPVVSTVVGGVNILPGERYDFILNADKPVGNYWMKFRGLDTCDNNTVSAYQMAILRYAGAPIEDPPQAVSYGYSAASGYVINPVSPDSPTMKGAITSLISTLPNDITVYQRNPDFQFIIEYDFRVINDSIYNRPIYFQGAAYPYHVAPLLPILNYIIMNFPPAPLLSQYSDVPQDMLCNEQKFIKEGRNCSKDVCMCTQLLKVPLNAVVQLVLIDDGYPVIIEDHPIHLHGYHFRVVAMGRFSEDNITAVEVKRLAKENKIVQRLDHAVYKDTVNVPHGGYAVIRFYTDNPGFWLLHCHIDVHLQLGMALVIQVGEVGDYPSVPKGFPKCGNF